MTRDELDSHQHSRADSWEVCDARGIYLCRVCEECEKAKRTTYRLDVQTDPNYQADEPIDPEDYQG